MHFAAVIFMHKHFPQCALLIAYIEQSNGANYFFIGDCKPEVAIIFLVEVGNLLQIGLIGSSYRYIKFFLLNRYNKIDDLMFVNSCIRFNPDFHDEQMYTSLCSGSA